MINGLGTFFSSLLYGRDHRGRMGLVARRVYNTKADFFFCINWRFFEIIKLSLLFFITICEIIIFILD